MSFLFFLPNDCLICRINPSCSGICKACEQELPWQSACCPCCAEPMEISMLCGRCLKDPPYFDKIYAPLRYEAAIKTLVMQLKFHEKLLCANVLSELLLESLTEDAPKIDFILPVPLHRHRLQERGFNQALEISKIIAKKWRVPLVKNRLKKTRHTLPQSQQHLQERQKNLHAAFSCTKNLSGQHIALIDDVVTTGSTVNEAAKVLKRAGAARVTVFAVARTAK